MLKRSIPFYKENIDLILEFLEYYLDGDDILVDIGCSTGLFLDSVRAIFPDIELVGIDSSLDMIEFAKKRGGDIRYLVGDILDIEIPKSKAIVMNYTLQFIRPIRRDEVILKIYNSLKDGGVFILSEKVISDDPIFHKQAIDIYYNFKKRNGYSEFEISQKREALENVLIPYTENENIELLRRNGFTSVEVIFKYLNFATYIARK
jgi:tRNA (cmo5U34)-methyltransferase